MTVMDCGSEAAMTILELFGDTDEQRQGKVR